MPGWTGGGAEGRPADGRSGEAWSGDASAPARRNGSPLGPDRGATPSSRRPTAARPASGPRRSQRLGPYRAPAPRADGSPIPPGATARIPAVGLRATRPRLPEPGVVRCRLLRAGRRPDHRRRPRGGTAGSAWDRCGGPRRAAECLGAATRRRRPARARTRPAGPGARLLVRHIDPWSTLKFSLVLAVAMFFVWLVAIGVLYGVLDGMGVFEQINGLYGEVSGNGGGSLFSPGLVLGPAASSAWSTSCCSPRWRRSARSSTTSAPTWSEASRSRSPSGTDAVAGAGPPAPVKPPDTGLGAAPGRVISSRTGGL